METWTIKIKFHERSEDWFTVEGYQGAGNYKINRLNETKGHLYYVRASQTGWKYLATRTTEGTHEYKGELN
jgi:hypothetical protein